MFTTFGPVLDAEIAYRQQAARVSRRPLRSHLPRHRRPVLSVRGQAPGGRTASAGAGAAATPRPVVRTAGAAPAGRAVGCGAAGAGRAA
ncbi:hypothetical protein [Thalassiella azotivora]